METFTIGELAEKCDMNVETLRYYERIGIMLPPPRSQSGHRAYAKASVDRLVFIRRAQSLGFTLKEIKELLELRRSEDEHCTDVVQSIDAKLTEVEAKISDLRSIREALTKMKELCQGDCLIGDCPILDSLQHSERHLSARRIGRSSGRRV